MFPFSPANCLTGQSLETTLGLCYCPAYTVFLVCSVELHILPSQYNNCFAAWIARDIYYVSYVSLCVYTLCRYPWFIYTYDVYSSVRNAFDTGSIHYMGKWEGVGPWKSRLFWAPNGTRLRARCHFIGRKKESISRAQPPPSCPRNGCCPHQKNYAQGRINHRCINSYYLPEPRSAEPHPRPAILHIPHAVLLISTVMSLKETSIYLIEILTRSRYSRLIYTKRSASYFWPCGKPINFYHLQN